LEKKFETERMGPKKRAGGEKKGLIVHPDFGTEREGERHSLAKEI